MRRAGAGALLLALLVGLGSLPLAAAPPPANWVDLAVGADGTLTLDAYLLVPNGSVLRFAMDGNFSPLIDRLPLDTSVKTNLTTQIATLEATPVLSALFGNRDGKVEANEVVLFEGLIQQETRLLPSGALTGVPGFNLSLDGKLAQASRLGPIGFEGVLPDGSTPVADDASASVTVASNLVLAFAYSGRFHELTLSLDPRLSSVAGVFVGSVQITLRAPAGTSISGSSGFDSTSVHNDPFGYGSPSLTGSYSPESASSATVSFEPAFQLGDVLILGAAGVAIPLIAFRWWRRRRRRRAAMPPPARTDSPC